MKRKICSIDLKEFQNIQRDKNTEIKDEFIIEILFELKKNSLNFKKITFNENLMKYFYKEKENDNEKIVPFNNLPNCLVFSIDSYNELLKFALFQEETETIINLKILNSFEKEFQSDCRIIKKCFFDDQVEIFKFTWEFPLKKQKKLLSLKNITKIMNIDHTIVVNKIGLIL